MDGIGIVGSRTGASQLSIVSAGARDLADRDLDATGGDVVAALSTDRLAASLGIDWLLEPDPDAVALATRRRCCRSLESASSTPRHAISRDDPGDSGSDRGSFGK